MVLLLFFRAIMRLLLLYLFGVGNLCWLLGQKKVKWWEMVGSNQPFSNEHL